MTEDPRIQRFPIVDIAISEGRRELQSDKVLKLAEAMQQLGLLSPIGVRIRDGKPHLVYGLHRLWAAFLFLGWGEIDCRIIEGDDRHARMVEIAENLHRAELTALERSEQVDEWIRLAEEMKREISAQVAQKFGPGRPEGGLSSAAREIDVDRDAARRAQTIAGLPTEAKVTAHELGLADNQAALLKAAKSQDPVSSLEQHSKQRRQTAEELAQRRTKKVQAEKEPVRASDMQEEAQREAKRAAALERVVTMLIEALEDRIAELVPDLEAITTAALAQALCERRPELFDRGEERPRVPWAGPRDGEARVCALSPETGSAKPTSLEAPDALPRPSPPALEAELPAPSPVGRDSANQPQTAFAEPAPESEEGSTEAVDDPWTAAAEEPNTSTPWRKAHENGGRRVSTWDPESPDSSSEAVDERGQPTCLAPEQEPSGTSAEELLRMWKHCRSNTQWWGRNHPLQPGPDEHFEITRRLVPFRELANKARPEELEGFMELSAPQEFFPARNR